MKIISKRKNLQKLEKDNTIFIDLNYQAQSADNSFTLAA